jgi:ATP-binding cassette subfamily F protein 3
VIFTSHDRHFMKRVASCIVEVRDGHVTNYNGQYEAYLYAVNKEIDEGEREQATRMAKAPPPSKPAKASPRPDRRNERDIRKEIGALERTIARLDDQKRQTNAALLEATDPAEALRLHNEVSALTTQLADAEERWCRLQEEIEAAE